MFFCFLFAFGCKQYLDVKPDKKLVVPSTVRDIEALLNNTRIFNIAYPGMGEVAAGDFYLLSANWKALSSPSVRNSYIWGDDIFNENERNEWSMTYNKVYNSNVILDAIKDGKIKDGGEEQIGQLKGAALFFRAYAFYDLLQLFAGSWDEKDASDNQGIPLRLTSNLNLPTTRASLSESYKRVIEDAKTALELVPERVPIKTMPDKAVVNALLARVFLNIGNYKEALLYSERALEGDKQLIDFNNVDGTRRFPFIRFNQEVLFYSLINTHSNLYPPAMKVDSMLFNSYEEKDLRKQLFYQKNVDGSYSFKGSFDGSEILFSGFTVGELYLIMAESQARMGQEEKASKSLNTLLNKRFMEGSFTPASFSSAEEVLDMVLKERRKELAFRGTRWSDLKRLNREVKYAVTLKRVIDGEVYELPANDSRYNFLIPRNIIAQSGIPQNPR